MESKKQKFSYSKLNTYESCAFKYFLTYTKSHFLFTDSLAAELGTTVHYVLELIGRSLINQEPIDYDKMKDLLMNVNIPKKNAYDHDGGVYGINILKEKYQKEFYEIDKQGDSYEKKIKKFLDRGIYRLEKWIKEHPGWRVSDVEKFFSMEYKGYVFSGYIDRVMKNDETGEIIIFDIKTKGKPFRDEDLITPLQFVIYSQALHESLGIPLEKIKCAYDLPFCDLIQDAGTSGFVNRGLKKIDRLFKNINEGNWAPKRSPLCYWCGFSATNPNQPEEGKYLCPYYSLWTPGGTKKGWEGANEWDEMANYDILIQKLKDKDNEDQLDLY